jgi:hypothetical protein
MFMKFKVDGIRCPFESAKQIKTGKRHGAGIEVFVRPNSTIKEL